MVVARGIADPKRLYVVGGSGGGLLTCYLTTITPRFRAAVSLYPVVDWASQTLTSDVFSLLNVYCTEHDLYVLISCCRAFKHWLESHAWPACW